MYESKKKVTSAASELKPWKSKEAVKHLENLRVSPGGIPNVAFPLHLVLMHPFWPRCYGRPSPLGFEMRDRSSRSCPWSDASRSGFHPPPPALLLQISSSLLRPSETEVRVEAFRWTTSAWFWSLHSLIAIGKRGEKKGATGWKMSSYNGVNVTNTDVRLQLLLLKQNQKRINYRTAQCVDIVVTYFCRPNWKLALREFPFQNIADQ